MQTDIARKISRQLTVRWSRERAELLAQVAADPEAAARAASLRYVSDGAPGIRRLRHRGGFRYLDPSGRPVRDPDVVARIRSLAIPPAWQDVWICTIPHGHLQATGRDARGRKQYRYHPRWRAVRDETKFDRMLEFGRALPRIRRQVARDLNLPGMPREKVLATIVRLLERTRIRVGNEEYARVNGSFGLTTFRNRHAKVNGSTVRFQFRGKSGKYHVVELTDARLARLIRACRDIPGSELFQFIDETGLHSIESGDVNEYLRQVSGRDFTAKDFRTWAGSVLAARLLGERLPHASARQARRMAKEVIEQVAGCLGNTPAICKRSYIHPGILTAYDRGQLATWPKERLQAADRSRLDPGEKAFLRLLESNFAPTEPRKRTSRPRVNGRDPGRRAGEKHP